MHKEALLSALEDILTCHSQEIGEFDLLRLLQEPPYSLFDKEALADTLLMFQSHFVLFNALYLLRDKWLLEQRACLEMVLTQIRVRPYQPGQVGLVEVDPLREYYLDWNNFSQTNREDVQGLITAFWQRIQGIEIKKSIQSREVGKAYETLLLEQGADFEQVKRQYRKLLHITHPDKGGDTQQTQNIEHAYGILRAVLR